MRGLVADFARVVTLAWIVRNRLGFRFSPVSAVRTIPLRRSSLGQCRAAIEPGSNSGNVDTAPAPDESVSSEFPCDSSDEHFQSLFADCRASILKHKKSGRQRKCHASAQVRSRAAGICAIRQAALAIPKPAHTRAESSVREVQLRTRFTFARLVADFLRCSRGSDMGNTCLLFPRRLVSGERT